MATVNNVVLRKVSFEDRILWMTIPVADKNCVSYAEYVSAAKTRFDLEDLELCDEYGVVIDERAFPFFANSVIHVKRLQSFNYMALNPMDPNDQYQIIHSQGTNLGGTGESSEELDDQFVFDNNSEMVVVVNTQQNLSQSLEKDENQIAATVSKSSQVSQLQVKEFVEKLKLKSGGTEILDAYAKTSELSKTNRQLLVNLAVQILIDKHGSHPPTSAKTDCAKIIVQQFPTLRDPGTKDGYTRRLISRGQLPARDALCSRIPGAKPRNPRAPKREWSDKFVLVIGSFFPLVDGKKLLLVVAQRALCAVFVQETFFDAKTHTGFLANRLKTVNRTLKPAKKIKLQEQPASIQDKPADIEETFSNEEMEEKLHFLSLADPKSEKDGIIKAMIDTYEHRKKHRDVILKDFPRFFDTPYLVRLEFSLMFPNVKFKKFNATKILSVFEKRYNSNGQMKEQVLHGGTENDDWDEDTRAFLALLLMLSCTVKGKPKSERQSSKTDVTKKLITFKKTGTPLDTIETATCQPCLIVLGPTRMMINSYYVAFEGNFIPLDANSSEDGFRQLLMSHFVFNTPYEEELKYFYQFLLSFYFGIEENVKFTARMRELRSLLWEEE